MMRFPLPCLLISALGCSQAPVAGICADTDDCPSGHVCLGEQCRQLCSVDVRCAGSQVCSADGVCQPGDDQPQAPRIDAVVGDGAQQCPATPGTACIDQGIIVAGIGLADATFELRAAAGGTGAYGLATSGTVLDAQVYLLLPDIATGAYTLTATNSAGSADAALTFLQGPEGPRGPTGPQGSGSGGGTTLTSDELVGQINGASLQLVTDVLPLGTGANEVAAGNHVHDAADLVSGVLAAGRLPIGGGPAQVAAGDHGHAGYAPAAHDHDGRYLQQLQSQEFLANSFAQGAVTVPMTPTGSSLCFLSKAWVSDVDGSNETAGCDVVDIGGTWHLRASATSGDDDDAYCGARCLTW